MNGYSNSEIAKKMYLSINTVKSCRKDMYGKLNIHSRKELFDIVKTNLSKHYK